LVDGEIVKLDHQGSTSLQIYDRLILSIKSGDTKYYQDMLQEDLTSFQREFCDDKGFLSIHETSSLESDQWEEFSIEDDIEFETTIIEKITQNLNSRNH
jgi:hypothetical protein